MLRLRRFPETNTQKDLNQGTTTTTTRTTTNVLQLISYRVKRNKHLSLLYIILLFLIIIIGNHWSRIVYFFHGIEKQISSPYNRAKIFNPYRTFHVHWMEHPGQLQNFSTRNAFVINMDKDVKRLKSLQVINPKLNFTRISGYEWNKATKNKHTMYEERFPFIRKAIQKGLLGDVGCFLSHVLLMERYLITNQQQEYILVVEDDVKVEDRALDVIAPQDADIIFLTQQTASKLVKVSSGNKKVNRVIGGRGSYGYIMTRKGAKTLMECLHFFKRSHRYRLLFL